MDVISKVDGNMEGWLYIIRHNRFGLHGSRKRYFILQKDCLRSYKTIPFSDNERPIRCAVVDSNIRVTDNGREDIQRRVFFIFTLYDTTNHTDQLKLGATSPEEAARWIRSLQDAVSKVYSQTSPDKRKDVVAYSKKKWPSLKICRTTKNRGRNNSVDWSSSIYADAVASDVIAPSPWKIFGCQNGLRLFKEAKDWDPHGSHWDDHPAIMAVGVVDGTSEATFQTLMSLGPSRSEWDFCFYRGTVIEHIDGHTDIIHKQLYSDWLPWGMKRRDLLLQRYWRREEDGTYVILYHSVTHRKCPRKRGYVRAWLKSGGYIITPVNKGTQSLVKHMLAVDWKYWRLQLRPSSARAITICMLERIAALREMLRAKSGNHSSEYLSGEFAKHIEISEPAESFKTEVRRQEEIMISEESHATEQQPEKQPSGRPSLVGLSDATDEFYDVPEPADFELLENEWYQETSVEHSPNSIQPKLSAAAVCIKKKLQDLAAQKKGYVELQDEAVEDNNLFAYGTTLQKDQSCTLPCSWTQADPSAFLIRGENYLKDRHKIKANGTSMQMVGADWLRSDRREDDLGSRPGGIVQKYAEHGRPEFFFIVNIQVPGSDLYSLALYFMTKSPLESQPLLNSFVNGDDAYRNSRFKLIPYISKGSWIVKQSVGKKACLLGQALEVHYVRGKNYMEVDIDVGSSTVARGVVNLVLGYLNNLVIEMAFMIQGNKQEELPEILLGTCRLNNLDASKSVSVNL